MAKQERKTKTAFEMAQELRSKGYKVSIVLRKEGGARISKINGQSFKGSKGNVEARKILGQTLTRAQTKHLEKIKQAKGVFGKAKKAPLSAEMLRLQEQANRAFRKQGQTARVTRSKIRYRLEKEGEKATLEYLKNARDYAKGFAPEGSLQEYLVRLQADNAKIESKDVEQVISYVEKLIATGKRLQEANFAELLDLTYNWEEARGTPLAMRDATFRHLALRILSRAE